MSCFPLLLSTQPETPLHYAASSREYHVEEDRVRVVESLLELGGTLCVVYVSVCVCVCTVVQAVARIG